MTCHNQLTVQLCLISHATVPHPYQLLQLCLIFLICFLFDNYFLLKKFVHGIYVKFAKILLDMPLWISNSFFLQKYLLISSATNIDKRMKDFYLLPANLIPIGLLCSIDSKKLLIFIQCKNFRFGIWKFYCSFWKSNVIGGQPEPLLRLF